MLLVVQCVGRSIKALAHTIISISIFPRKWPKEYYIPQEVEPNEKLAYV